MLDAALDKISGLVSVLLIQGGKKKRKKKKIYHLGLISAVYGIKHNKSSKNRVSIVCLLI